jgi:phosphopantothenoylcysteine decarboxylase/phosphopantothenate--cysteine ligase
MANIIIGISGSIAAVKSINLIHELVLQGHKCAAIVTTDGLNFVTITALASQGADVYTDDMYQKNGHRYGNNYSYASIMEHINLAKWADLIVVVPASANTIAKLAHGFADNLLTTTILASPVKTLKVIVPAMNGQMWHNPITQDNLKRLQRFGFMQWGPTFGKQACGDVDLGRMLEVADILKHIDDTLNNNSNNKNDEFNPNNQPDSLRNPLNHLPDLPDSPYLPDSFHVSNSPKPFLSLHIVITAGGTLEPIDPVRYIANHSSGKMGYSIAEVAINWGAKVTLISGSQVALPIPPGVHKFIKVITADEMLSHVMIESKHADIFIGCAAVSDYKVLYPASQKIKKSGDINSSGDIIGDVKSAKITLELVENPDIIYTIKQTYPNLFVVGFAAETQNIIENATKKMIDKNLDMIIANDVSEGKVFGENEAQVTIITKCNESSNEFVNESDDILDLRTSYPSFRTTSFTTDLLPKYQIAQLICEQLLK